MRCRTSARTITRILARTGTPHLWDPDPVIGVQIRAPWAMDRRSSGRNPGFDYVHVAVDDYTRSACAEVLPDERPDPDLRPGKTAKQNATARGSCSVSPHMRRGIGG